MKAPVSIYLRLINYNAIVLTSNGTHDPNIAPITNVLDTGNAQFIRISNYNSDVEQALNIGSQSAGAGAGKIVFNPLRLTKFIDAVSPVLFELAASGTPFRTAEVFFVNAKNVIQVMQTYKLVAVKTVSWEAATGEPNMTETVTFEYGGLIVTVYQHDHDGAVTNVSQAGWNRVKNISDSDLNSVIS